MPCAAGILIPRYLLWRVSSFEGKKILIAPLIPTLITIAFQEGHYFSKSRTELAAAIIKWIKEIPERKK